MTEQRINFGWRKPPRPVLWLMIALGALWVFFAISINWLGFGAPLFRELIGQSTAVLHGQLWRLVTAPLLHPPQAVWGVIFSVLVLYFFATPLYERWGARRLYLFLFGCAAFAFAVESIAHAFLPGITAEVWGGASVMADAALVAWALGAPGGHVLFMFVLPLRPMVMVALVAGIHLMMIMARVQNELLAPFAAMLAGWCFSDHSPLRRLYLKLKLKRLQAEVRSLERDRKRRRAAGPKLRVIPGGAERDNGEPPDESALH
jgi:membrane associated rhomboid family serine protease